MAPGYSQAISFSQLVINPKELPCASIVTAEVDDICGTTTASQWDDIAANSSPHPIPAFNIVKAL